MGGVAKIWSTRKQPESVSWFGFGVILVAEPPSSENWSSVYGRRLNLSEVSELVALQLMRSNRALEIDLLGGGVILCRLRWVCRRRFDAPCRSTRYASSGRLFSSVFLFCRNTTFRFMRGA